MFSHALLILISVQRTFYIYIKIHLQWSSPEPVTCRTLFPKSILLRFQAAETKTSYAKNGCNLIPFTQCSDAKKSKKRSSRTSISILLSRLTIRTKSNTPSCGLSGKELYGRRRRWINNADYRTLSHFHSYAASFI